MTIGTAAPSVAERAAVAHHLVEFLDPHERYSAARFAEDALAAIETIHARGRRAIVVGGTGFYIRALTGGVALAPQYDAALRDRLAREARMHPSEFLHEWLALVDPARAGAISPGDEYRILRALEVALSARDDAPPRLMTRSAALDFVKVFLDVPLDVVDAAIDVRTNDMLARGLVEEAERIGADAVAATAVGYPQALAYARGWATREELFTSVARATRRYARRQRSWFRREPETRWLVPAAVRALAGELPGWS